MKQRIQNFNFETLDGTLLLLKCTCNLCYFIFMSLITRKYFRFSGSVSFGHRRDRRLVDTDSIPQNGPRNERNRSRGH